METPRELPIIVKLYDLILWTMNHTTRFPRHHRYSLGQRVEGTLQDLLGRWGSWRSSRTSAATLSLSGFAAVMCGKAPPFRQGLPINIGEATPPLPRGAASQERECGGIQRKGLAFPHITAAEPPDDRKSQSNVNCSRQPGAWGHQ